MKKGDAYFTHHYSKEHEPGPGKWKLQTDNGPCDATRQLQESEIAEFLVE